MNLPFAKSSLRRAIERGLANGKLRDELHELEDVKVKSRSDAEAICWGLEQLNGSHGAQLGQQTYALAGLFQTLQNRDNAAFEPLRERGIPELVRLFNLISESPTAEDADALMFILKILGLYGTVEGALKIVEAARQPLKPDAYMWSIILSTFTAGHPEKDLLFSSLREPLPSGFIAVALLAAANDLLIKGDSMSHPFDASEGKQRLRDWLISRNSEEFSYAHSAAAALPFVSNPERDSLLTLAMNHPRPSVRMEAAWAAAKLGRDDGLQLLVEHCQDFNTARNAKQYLSELGREDVIPAEANEPDFAALAEFAQWCAHPNELGRAPDEMKIVDHRELRWPPERAPKPFWLIKYVLYDTTGLEDDSEECGLVGGITFCFFSYKLAQRPPEDAYAVHCYWEMEHKDLIEQADVRGHPDDYSTLIQQWSGPALENVRMLFVAELSPELKYPQRLVGLASARLNGELGWVVLDGPRSEWYVKAEQPADISRTYEQVVLKIHVGRNLLGFKGNPDRRRYLAPETPPKPPEQIVAAYEKLLAEAQGLQGKKRRRAFHMVERLHKHFDSYVDALVRLGRASEVRALVQGLEPDWGGGSGWGTLGTAAFNAGHLDLAERFLLNYRDQCANYERGEEMALLAELWCKTGRHELASNFLLDCLFKIVADSKSATGADVAFLEEKFQNQRSEFLRLFPFGEALLVTRGIPASTVSGKTL